MLSQDLRNIVAEAENKAEAGPLMVADWYKIVINLYDIADRLQDFERMAVVRTGDPTGDNIVCLATGVSSKEAPNGN